MDCIQVDEVEEVEEAKEVKDRARECVETTEEVASGE